MTRFSSFHSVKALSCAAVFAMSFQTAMSEESDINEFLAHRASLRAIPMTVTYTYRMTELNDGMALTEGSEFICVLHQRDDKYRLEVTDTDGKLLQLFVHDGEDTLVRASPEGNLSRATEKVFSSADAVRMTQHLDFVRWSFKGGDETSAVWTSSGSSHSQGPEAETILFSRGPAHAPESELLEWPDRADLHNWSSDRTIAGWRVPNSVREELRDRTTDPSRSFVFEYKGIQYEVLESLNDALFDISMQVDRRSPSRAAADLPAPATIPGIVLLP